MYYEDNTSNVHVSMSSDTVQCSATSSETEDAATNLPAESLLLSSDAGSNILSETPFRNEGCQQTKFLTFLREK